MLNTWNNKAAVGAGGGFSASRLPSAFAPRPRPWRRLPTGPRSGLVLQGLGKETVGTWLDLASFVSAAGSGARTPYDELADRIGRDVYIDVAGWHLFLKDVRLGGGGLTLAQGLAQQLGQQIDGGGFKAADLQQLLQKVPIKLGQGRTTVALFDVLPTACVRDLENICEDYAKRR